ncbi:glycerate kinase [Ruminococcaceae bacterium OttesenSCG-928-D13]|nr:glycerate kinase [Ruminococcaceae bacterium OttesenSCG-928-D13]
MEKIICIPDSYKGTLSSLEICDIVGERFATYFPSCERVLLPVADGGEGSVDCFLAAMGGEKVFTPTVGPYFEEMQGYYGLVENGATAIIEVASCAGLPLVGEHKNPLLTTTFGVGTLMLEAAKKGVNKILLAVGGSCTNDAGCGAAAACGVRFLDSSGKEFTPVGGTLESIAKIDVSRLHPALRKVEIVIMCDIDNPMYGRNGAAWIYGPQKGADEAMIHSLDNGLIHLAGLIKQDLKTDVSKLPGGGAGGAMGAGMAAFMGTQLKMGIDLVLDMVQFDQVCAGADLVITGEGRLDRQSLRGKVIAGVAKRAKRAEVPVLAIVGGYELDIDEIYDFGVSAVFSINRLPQTLAQSQKDSAENLRVTVDNILRYHQALLA